MHGVTMKIQFLTYKFIQKFA